MVKGYSDVDPNEGIQFPPPNKPVGDTLISPCGLYRYWLERRWNGVPCDAPAAVFVMLNPSTADATLDDPTIRKCVGFAQRWRFNRLVVVNLFAYRATDPSKLDDVEDPVGELNLFRVGQTLVTEGKKGQIIYAWGAQPASRFARAGKVAKILRRSEELYYHEPKALSLTKLGWPAHPLYRPYSDVPKLFRWPVF